MVQKITNTDVEKLAALTKLPLSDAEKEKLSMMLSDTLVYMNLLNELDTENVAETYQVGGSRNVFMGKDHPTTTLDKNSALFNAKEAIDGLFATEPVFGAERNK